MPSIKNSHQSNVGHLTSSGHASNSLTSTRHTVKNVGETSGAETGRSVFEVAAKARTKVTISAPSEKIDGVNVADFVAHAISDPRVVIGTLPRNVDLGTIPADTISTVLSAPFDDVVKAMTLISASTFCPEGHPDFFVAAMKQGMATRSYDRLVNTPQALLPAVFSRVNSVPSVSPKVLEMVWKITCAMSHTSDASEPIMGMDVIDGPWDYSIDEVENLSCRSREIMSNHYLGNDLITFLTAIENDREAVFEMMGDLNKLNIRRFVFASALYVAARRMKPFRTIDAPKSSSAVSFLLSRSSRKVESMFRHYESRGMLALSRFVGDLDFRAASLLFSRSDISEVEVLALCGFDEGVLVSLSNACQAYINELEGDYRANSSRIRAGQSVGDIDSMEKLNARFEGETSFINIRAIVSHWDGLCDLGIHIELYGFMSDVNPLWHTSAYEVTDELVEHDKSNTRYMRRREESDKRKRNEWLRKNRETFIGNNPFLDGIFAH